MNKLKVLSFFVALMVGISSVGYAMASSPFQKVRDREYDKCRAVIGPIVEWPLSPVTDQQKKAGAAWQGCQRNAGHIANQETSIDVNNPATVAFYAALVLPASWFNPNNFGTWEEIRDTYAAHVTAAYSL